MTRPLLTVRGPPRRLGAAVVFASLGWALASPVQAATPDDPAPALASRAILDDAEWDALLDGLATGRVADPLGGVRSLTPRELGALLAPGLPPPVGPWFAPAARAALFASGAAEYDRGYSQPLHPLQVAGGLALSCEFQAGRPCGDGASGGLELDSAAGYSSWLTAGSRVRAWGGSVAGAPGLEVDRLFLRFDLGRVWLQAGRDAVAVGPSLRSQTMLSTHAAPLDGVQAGLRPLALTPWLRASLFYTLGRLRDPQTFSGTLIDLARLQLDLFDVVQLGGSRILQLGGDGAPPVGGLWGFVEEHFGRSYGGGIAENNRLALDAAVRVPALGLRVYGELAFEDTHDPLLNAVEWEADHLLGVEVRAGLPAPLRRFAVEYLRTSWISQVHGTFTTGMTNAGRTLGSPLGPDAQSLWARADLALGAAEVSPWFEWVRCFSDVIGETQAAGNFLVQRGPQEHRQRAGADLRFSALGLSWSGGVFAERVAGAGFVPGETRLGLGGRLVVSASPRG